MSEGTSVWFSRDGDTVYVAVRIEVGDKVADGTIKLSREERDKLLDLLVEARDFYAGDNDA